MNIDDETTGTGFSSEAPYDCIESRQHSPATLTRGALLGVVILGAVWTIGAAHPGTTDEHRSSFAAVASWSTDAPSAYGPGGSVYHQQVPGSNWTDQVPTSYAPGGSVYRSQVPAQAR
ncbi:MAG: hypothetical protein QOI76_1055 [Frankiales bacterium]|nr:hypothetical protein [Frankiales bacterium]